jgi:Ca2+-binding RTX toxin-like protein
MVARAATRCGWVATKASVDLGEGTAAYGTESTDEAILSDIENVLTGIGRDTLIGDDGPNVLIGDYRRDAIDGGEGDDLLFGDGAPDSIYDQLGLPEPEYEMKGRDQIAGGEGNDALNGGSRVDFLDGGAGVNTNDGGEGEDTCLNPETATEGAINCEL